MDKKEFKEKLQRHIEAQKGMGFVFDDDTIQDVENLSILFYDKPIRRWTKKTAEGLQRILNWENLKEDKNILPEHMNRTEKGEIQIHNAAPELLPFLEWIQSDNFIKAISLQKDTQLNIVDLFYQIQQEEREKKVQLEKEEAQEKEKKDNLETPDRFIDITNQTRQKFLDKVKTLIPPSEYCYLFEFTQILIRENKEQNVKNPHRYDIKIWLPVSENEAKRFGWDSIDIIDNLENFLPILNDELEYTFGIEWNSRTHRRYTYLPLESDIYIARKDKIKKRYGYAPFETREKQRPAQQQELPFNEEPVNIQKHSGMEMPLNMINDWIRNNRYIRLTWQPWLIIQNQTRDPKQSEALIRYYKQSIEKSFSFRSVTQIECDQLYKQRSREYSLAKGDTTEGGKNARTIISQEFAANVIIIENFEKLSGKVVIQEWILQELQSEANKKFLICCNIPIVDLPEAEFTGQKENKKPGYRNGFIPEFLRFLKLSGRASIVTPPKEDCGNLLSIQAKETYSWWDNSSQNFIKLIGQSINDPAQNEAILKEILLVTKGWKIPLDIEKSKQIVANRIRHDIDISLQDIHSTTFKYFTKTLELTQNETTNKMIQQTTAYIGLAFPTKDNKYRNTQEIATFLKKSPKAINEYMKTASENIHHINEIKKALDALRLKKENEILLGIK